MRLFSFHFEANAQQKKQKKSIKVFKKNFEVLMKYY